MMYKNIHDWLAKCALAACLGPVSLLGQEAAHDKRDDSWARPTPRAALREMTTDRPDATESPFTVDAGHVQVEMDFAGYTRDRADGVTTTEWEAAPFNLRFGLTHNFELGVFLTPFHSTETKTAGGRERHAGLGDTTLRAKWNGAGNDDGGLGWGLIADLKLPTAAGGLGNDKVEGGVTLPLAFDLGGGWGGGAMTAAALVYTDAGRHEAVWINTVTAGRDLTGTVGGFLELTSETGAGAHAATFNCGLTRSFGPDLQLDAGAGFGLSRAAADFSCFAGLARRF